jgi:propionyl-CoA synthetase
MGTKYESIYQQSIADPEQFWSEAAKAIDWITPWKKVLDKQNNPHLRWFSGATLNTCFNCVDRHVDAGRGNQAAIIYDSPVTNTKETLTYRTLQEKVARFAGA